MMRSAWWVDGLRSAMAWSISRCGLIELWPMGQWFSWVWFDWIVAYGSVGFMDVGQ